MDDGMRIDAKKLWAGAAATVVVAALVAAVGVLVVETLVDVNLLPPTERGVLGWSHRASYPAGAAVLALGAAGILHLLLLGVPRPMVFFGWLMALDRDRPRRGPVRVRRRPGGAGVHRGRGGRGGALRVDPAVLGWPTRRHAGAMDLSLGVSGPGGGA